jgi:hypothetical protein
VCLIIAESRHFPLHMFERPTTIAGGINTLTGEIRTWFLFEASAGALDFGKDFGALGLVALGNIRLDITHQFVEPARITSILVDNCGAEHCRTLVARANPLDTLMVRDAAGYAVGVTAGRYPSWILERGATGL